MRITEFLDADEAESTQPPPSDGPQWVTVNGDGVLDRFDQAADWADILEPAGWTEAKPQDRETLQAWKRPGGTYDISAKVLKANPHVLVVHSDAAGLPYGPKQKNTKGRVYAHLHYAGDLSAASKALVRGGAVGLPAHVIEACKAAPGDPLEGLWSGPRPSAGQGHQSDGEQGQREDDRQDHQKKGRFTVRTFADIQPRTSTWLLPGVLPDDDLTVFIGEEGIGKGLFSADVIARVTRAGHNVLIIATEDHFETVLRPRLDVAGADVSRCIFMVMDPDTLQGQPHLPHDVPEVEAVINEYGVRLVYIDPWVSSVSGGLRLRDTQEARRAIDPLVSMARRTHCSVLAVAHPNRGEGDLRARVGLSAVLRQAARLLLFAIEPPDDDTKLIIGIEKANETARAPASVYRKLPKKHPMLPKSVWAVEEITDAPRLTIRQWHDQYRNDRDRRTTDRWVQVLAAAKDNLIQRADIISIYEESGSDESAANKAIGRWVKTGKLLRREAGVYELVSN
jgi:hypothetical protein